MRIFENFDLGKISWLQVGGNARLFIIIENLLELEDLARQYNKLNIIGACSNLLSEGNIEDPVIKLSGDFSKLELIKEHYINCGAAVLSRELSNFALNNSLSGIEQFYTIPGTVGGLIKMNSGCYGLEVKDVIKEIKIFDIKTKNFQILKNIDINFEYRNSNISDNIIILSGMFECKKDIKDNIKQKMEFYEKNRSETQIKNRTCGSTFKNQKNISAWQVIDKIAMRGYQIGGAKFSNKHSNFIETENNVKTQDIKELIQEAKNRAKKLGINLDEEIKFLK